MSPRTARLSFLRILSLSILFVAGIFVSGCDSGPNEDDGGGAPTFSLLQTDGHRIVDEDGDPVILKGVNLGNWLIMEMWMLGVGGNVPDQHTFEAILSQRFGEEEKDRLMDVYRESFITERDFDIIRSFDMNVIRLPFWYRLLEDDANPFEIRPDGFKWLDWAIEQAEARGLYVILDMHGAPGAQWTEQHAGREKYNRLWSDPEYQERTVWLWKEIAARYAGRESVAGYDLLNEPWGGSQQALKSIMDRCYHAIRSVDPDHIVIFSGHFNDVRFLGKPQDNGWTNAVYTVHNYPGLFGNGDPTIETHRQYIKQQIPSNNQTYRALGAPILVGEFNVVYQSAGGGEMMRRYFDLYGDYGWAGTMWSYKVLTNEGGIPDRFWGMVTNAENRPDFDIRNWSKVVLEARLRELATMEYDVYEDLKYWLTTDEEPAPL